MHIEHWVAEGHRVTVIAGSHAGDGTPAEMGPLLTIHRLRAGGILPFRAAWAVFRGAAGDADVVLEVVGRRAFLTPLWTWLSQPRAALVTSTSRRGLGRVLFDGLGVQHLYRGTPQLDGHDAAGASSLETLRRAAQEGHRPLIAVVRASETFKAVGLAAATLAGNAIALLFTIVFTRILGPSGYGSLASLISAFLILSIGGSALQVAAARETALGNLGSREEIAETLSAWLWRLGLAGLVLTAGALLLRHPISHVVTVPNHPWAAASTIPTAALWVALSLQRGVLQGLHAYGPVGTSIVVEAGGRLVGGLALVAAGADVTGAYLGTPIALAITMLVLVRILRRRLGPPHGHHEMRRLRALFAASRAPVAALMLFAVLQNIDVIVVHARIGGDRAGSYAAAAVAAKLVVWVGIGIGLYLLPEATRRRAAGEDPREVLLRGLGVLALVAAPALLVFAAVPHLLLKVAFGPKFTQADEVLLVLGIAMTLLTVTYLSVQYLLALGRQRFLWVLVFAAAIEPALLFSRDYSLLGFGTAVLAVQAIAAAGMTALAFGLRPTRTVPAALRR
jgi:O-antigen/teichoic acid export membrane protein